MSRYYLEHISAWQGSTPSCRFVNAADAAKWLLLMGKELPEDLKNFEDEVSE